MTTEQVTNRAVLTVGGLTAILALATQLGYLGPKEQIAELRQQRQTDLQRVERLEAEVMNVSNDVSALVLARCMDTDNEAVWTTLRCSARMGRDFDTTPPRRRR